jgi:2-dehydropantoate 2-reductase
MRFLIYGAGAIGGYLGALMTEQGNDVTLVGRGPHRDVLATAGLKIEGKGNPERGRIRCNAILAGEEKPPYDVVIVTLKAHSVEPNAAHIAPLAGRDGCYVFLQNGLPWWYFDKITSPYAGTRLKSLDPNGVLERTFPSERVIGGVIFKPIDLYEPGAMRSPNAPTDRIVIGEIDNSANPRLDAIAKVFTQSGWRGEPSTDIRTVIWSKLTGNAVWNALCALTQASQNEIASYPPTRDLAIAVMEEAYAVAKASGAKIEVNATKAVGDTANRAPAVSSTLADVRAGRQLELAALNGAIMEMAEIMGIPTPNMRNVVACAGMLDQFIVKHGMAVRPVAIR